MTVRSLPMKNRKRLARDVFNAFAAHTGRVYDVTDADYLSENGSTHDFQTSILHKEKRNGVNNGCVYMFVFHSCTYDP